MTRMNPIRRLMLTGFLCLAASPALAQEVKQQPAAKEPSVAEQQHTLEYLKVLISALQSDKVEEPVKGALVGCLYGNSLRTIGLAMDEAISKAPASFSRTDPNNLLGLMAHVCGYKPEPGAVAGSPAPATKPKPKPKPTSTVKGR